MSYRDPRVKQLEDRRRRCRSLVRQIGALCWQRVQRCDLCRTTEIAIVANCDRYGIPLQAGMCLNCGLVFLLDRLNLEGYREFYANYYRPLISQFFGRPINAVSIQSEQSSYGSRLVRSLGGWLDSMSPTPVLLDIGGSTGTVALEFYNAVGYQPTILDPAANEIQVAKAKGLKVVEGFLETYEQGEQQFDLVLMCQTIDHLFALRNSVSRVRELVKTDGRFFCDIVDFDEECFSKGCVEGALHLDHCYYLSQETALWMFASLGWRVIHIDTATQPGHVGYFLKLGNVDDKEPLPDIATRLRGFQRLQTQWQLASQRTYGTLHWLRKRAYRGKRYLREYSQRK